MRRVSGAQNSAPSATSAVGCCPGASWPQGALGNAEGSPLANEYDESFDSELLDELMNREILYALAEAKVLVSRHVSAWSYWSECCMLWHATTSNDRDVES